MDGSSDDEIDSTGNGWRSILALLAWNFRMRMGEQDRRRFERFPFRGEILFEKAPGYLIVTFGRGRGVCAVFGAVRGEAVARAEEIGAAWDRVLQALA